MVARHRRVHVAGLGDWVVIGEARHTSEPQRFSHTQAAQACGRLPLKLALGGGSPVGILSQIRAVTPARVRGCMARLERPIMNCAAVHETQCAWLREALAVSVAEAAHVLPESLAVGLRAVACRGVHVDLVDRAPPAFCERLAVGAGDRWLRGWRRRWRSRWEGSGRRRGRDWSGRARDALRFIAAGKPTRMVGRMVGCTAWRAANDDDRHREREVQEAHGRHWDVTTPMRNTGRRECAHLMIC